MSTAASRPRSYNRPRCICRRHSAPSNCTGDKHRICAPLRVQHGDDRLNMWWAFFREWFLRQSRHNPLRRTVPGSIAGQEQKRPGPPFFNRVEQMIDEISWMRIFLLSVCQELFVERAGDPVAGIPADATLVSVLVEPVVFR